MNRRLPKSFQLPLASVRTNALLLIQPVEGWKLNFHNKILKRLFTDDDVLISDEFKLEEVLGDFRFTPDLPYPETLVNSLSDVLEEVTLVPYGCTKLRISVFPNAKSSVK